MDPAPQVRVSDAEREAVVARLNTATGEGRLTLEEFGDRAGQAYAARTQGELARLVEDLPAVAGARPRVSQVTPVGAVKRSGRWRLGRRQAYEDDARDFPNAPLLRLRVDTVVGSVKVYRV